MIYLTGFTLAFAFIRLLVSLINNLTETHLPCSEKIPDKKVSVLIPARNEEANIGYILEDLKNQSYKNIEVIVFNDQSEDRTGYVVAEYVNSDNRFRLINSDCLPEGWYGKNYACHSLAGAATGEYLLFLDADVRAGKSLISDSINMAEDNKTGLISIFPGQKIISFGEAVTVPNMNFILLSLLPLILVRKSAYPSLSAANGQFMLFEAKTYREIMPHKKMKMEKVEDIEIARFFKRQSIPVACLLGDERIECRMYRGFSDSVNGFSKNVVSFFGNSFLLALMFWIVTTFGFLLVLNYMPLSVFIIYIAVELLIRILISVASRQSVMKNILCSVPLQLSLGLFIYKAFKNKYFGNYEWKGRKIN